MINYSYYTNIYIKKYLYCNYMSLFVNDSNIITNSIFLEGQVTRKEITNIAIFEFEYPYVYITFNHEQITDDYNLEIFFQTWLSIYNDKKPYIIIFDGTKVQYAKPGFIFKFVKFMKKLRKQEPQYLQYSIIIIDNSFIRGLMNMVFRIQKPVAPVYLCKSADELLELHNKIHKNTASRVVLQDNTDVTEQEIKKMYFDNNYREENI
uniref:Uncharacterized protein n=1 Tax=viral metagenome TaxID=1070528 RepID=A0A6C0AXQ8_9ZZZZ